MPPVIVKGEYGLRPYAGRSPAGRPKAALCGAFGAAARPEAGLGRALGRGIQRASRAARDRSKSPGLCPGHYLAGLDRAACPVAPPPRLASHLLFLLSSWGCFVEKENLLRTC